MSDLPSPTDLAASVARFVGDKTPAKARWEYAFSRVSYQGRHGIGFNARTYPVIARVLGIRPTAVKYRIWTMWRQGGYDAALAHFAARPFWANQDAMKVGPLEPWQVGHVYFAQLADFPHIAKVGFSRRIAQRLEEIADTSKCRVALRNWQVGTLADEHWWHRDWTNLRIAGEWFYWPKSTERVLPTFLQEAAGVAA